LLLAGAVAQVAQGEGRGVVKSLPGGLAQRALLVDDAGDVEQLFRCEHRGLRVLEHGVEPAQHRHRQDHVAVFAAHVEVAQHIVGDAPDETHDSAINGGIHAIPVSGYRRAART